MANLKVPDEKAKGFFSRIGSTAVEASRRIQDFEAKIAETIPTLSSLLEVAKGGIAAFLGFEVLQQAGRYLGEFTRSSLDAALALERLETALEFSQGSAVGGAAALKLIRDEAGRLNIPITAAQEGFKGLSAATRNTALEGAVTEDLFKGLSAASATLGLDEETAGRAF
ncbi:MAG: hypothetical protein U5M53_06985 [Rhodoferax sp.]|nr:hypothetical protein [Rhodoferax sp.]